MHKSDVEILQLLIKNDCTSEVKSYSILKLLALTKYKYSKVHGDLNNLLTGEYVQKGLKNERADTYYITEKGINKLKGLMEC